MAQISTFLNRGFQSIKDAVIVKPVTDIPWNTVTIIPESRVEYEDCSENDFDDIDGITCDEHWNGKAEHLQSKNTNGFNQASWSNNDYLNLKAYNVNSDSLCSDSDLPSDSGVDFTEKPKAKNYKTEKPKKQSNTENPVITKTFPLIIFGQSPKNESQTEELVELGVSRVISITTESDTFIQELAEVENLEIVLNPKKLSENSEKNSRKTEFEIPSIGDIYQCLGFIESSPGIIYIHSKNSVNSGLIVTAAKMRYSAFKNFTPASNCVFGSHAWKCKVSLFTSKQIILEVASEKVNLI